MEKKANVMVASQLELSKITFSDVKTIAGGPKLIFLNMGNNPFYIQTPELDLPFDSELYNDGGKEGEGKININVSLKGFTEVAVVKDFHDKMCELDEIIKVKASENSVAWFKKAKMSQETVDSLYTNMIRVSKDPETGEPNGKFAPTFRFKVEMKNHDWKCRFFDENKVEIDLTENAVLDLIKMKTKVQALIKCTSVWIAGGKFGCSWKAEQIIVKREKTLDKFAFIDIDDKDDEPDGDQFVNSESDEEEEVVQGKK